MKNMFPGWLVWMALALTGCGGGGGSPSPEVKSVPVPLTALSTSYENKNLRLAELDASQIPVMAADAALWTQVPESLAFGDFFQEGKYAAFVAANPKNGGMGKAYFLKKNDLGTWIDATADVLTDSGICTNVVQAISADFNGDSKPDIYVACGGSAGAMRQVFFMSKSGQIAYERQETSFTLQQSWGAAAGDIDGDGDIDLVVTDSDLTVAVMNNGMKQGASSFTKDTTGRAPTNGGQFSFPTLHRKVFLIPKANGNPDLVITGTGAGANYTAIYLKNDIPDTPLGRFIVNPDRGTSALFENKVAISNNNISVKFYDVVGYNDALYVLAKNVGVELGRTATDLLVLKYESPSTITPSNALLNLTAENSGVLFSTQVNSPTADGFISQFKINTTGHLVAFDGACAVASQRCAFEIEP